MNPESLAPYYALVSAPMLPVLQGATVSLPPNRAAFHLGSHRSGRRGDGQTFREHRAYLPGDDLRRIDWRVFGRNERLVIRESEQEVQSSLLVLVDGSAASDYKSQRGDKWVKLQEIAAVLTIAGLAQGDPCACIVTTADQAPGDLRPVRRPEVIARLGHALADHRPQGPSSALTWLSYLREQTGLRRTTVVYLSDFLDPSGNGEDDAFFDALPAARQACEQLQLVRTLHLDEIELPGENGDEALEFIDPFSQSNRRIGTRSQLLTDYQMAMAQHQARLQSACKQAGALLHTMVLNDGLASQVQQLCHNLLGTPTPSISSPPPEQAAQ